MHPGRRTKKAEEKLTPLAVSRLLIVEGVIGFTNQVEGDLFTVECLLMAMADGDGCESDRWRGFYLSGG